MIHLKIEDNQSRRLPFFLAMEEWAARALPPADYFFSWQVNPSVIFGRNQRIDAEVNLDYCRDNGIETYRRKSGGGCVFADRHNIMFSYITPTEQVTTTFGRYTKMIANMLQTLGINAEASGRNDIMIDGRKVSGNAFYHLPGRSIVHGTMLYDTDFRHIANAITPSRSKLESKQVQSVEAHITTLNQHIEMSIGDFNCYAINHLTDDELVLTEAQLSEINELSKPYYEPEWIFGRRSEATIRHTRRIEGAGEFSVGITLHDGCIADINLEGDFFLLSDLDTTLLNRLAGVRYVDYEIEHALAGTDVTQTIAGLSTEQFIKLII